MRPASQRFFIHSCIYLRILIISYLATFLGDNSLSVLMCRKAVNQSSYFANILSNNQLMQFVSQFRYLGYIINNDITNDDDDAIKRVIRSLFMRTN